MSAFIAELIRDRSARSGLYGFFPDESPKPNGYAHLGPAQSGYEANYPDSVPSSVMRQCATEADEFMKGLSLGMEGSLLPNDGATTPTNDSRMVTVSKEWATCMAAGGYQYLTPLDALNDPRWRDEATPSDAQQKVATTDVECKVRTNLVGVAAAVQNAYDRAYFEENSDALKEVSYLPPSVSS